MSFKDCPSNLFFPLPSLFSSLSPYQLHCGLSILNLPTFFFSLTSSKCGEYVGGLLTKDFPSSAPSPPIHLSTASPQWGGFELTSLFFSMFPSSLSLFAASALCFCSSKTSLCQKLHRDSTAIHDVLSPELVDLLYNFTELLNAGYRLSWPGQVSRRQDDLRWFCTERGVQKVDLTFSSGPLGAWNLAEKKSAAE